MDIPLTCVNIDQQALRRAFEKRDIEAFRENLHKLEDIESIDDNRSISLFEEICQTPGCAAFISECLHFGCDVNKVNESHQKRPIHFAIESFDVRNITALLDYPNVDIDAKYANSTPINYLCDQITTTNFVEIFPCIKMFVKHSANLNIPNGRSMTPVNTILKKKHEQLLDEYKKEILSYIFNNVSGVDIDSHRNGEARAKLKELWPDREFPRIEPNQSWNFTRLIECLHNENEAEFLHGLNFINESNSEKLSEYYTSVENDETLLTLAIKRGLIGSVERMIRTGVNVNYSNSEQRPIEIACKCGQWKIVEMLLKSPAINVENVQMPLLSIVINLKDETNQSENCDYNKCLMLLLAHKSIDINQIEESSQITALHYAVRNHDADAIRTLLSNGAYIGIRSKFDQMSISNIDPIIFEQHLDRCIKTNGLRPTDENFAIEFDYKNLVPPGIHVNESEQSSSLHRKFHDEMESIDYIARSKELKHLIQHPVISSFLFLKWARLAFMFYINFAIFVAFAISMTVYIFVCLDMSPNLYIIRDVLRFLTSFLLFCIIVREFLHMWYLQLKHFRNISNCVDILLIVLCVLAIYFEGEVRPIDAAVILLLAYELFSLAGSLPYSVYSTHFVMFKTVTLSFLKSFALYAIIIIAFSLSFFTLLHKPNQTTRDNDNHDADDLNRFDSVQLAVLKTLVMLTGEFDAASIDFARNFWNYLFFVVFLFVVSTVLFNLLNGLAVSDIQMIKAEAELNHQVRRTHVLAQYEAVSASGKAPHFFGIFEHGSSIHRARVKPFNNNQISLHGLNIRSLILLDFVRLCICHGPYKMDKKIVKRSINVLEKSRKEEAERAETDVLLQKIDKLETMLLRVTNHLIRE